MVAVTVPADARAVICLAGLRPVSDVDAALAANEEAFQLATTIAAGYEADGGLFVTVQDTGGDYGLHATNGERAWLGGLSGLAKTAAQEWPKAVVRTIDLAAAQLAPAAAAERLAEELLNGAADLRDRADGRRRPLCLCLHRKGGCRRRCCRDAGLRHRRLRRRPRCHGCGRDRTGQNCPPTHRLAWPLGAGRGAGCAAGDHRRCRPEKGAAGRGPGQRPAPDAARTGRRCGTHPRRRAKSVRHCRRCRQPAPKPSICPATSPIPPPPRRRSTQVRAQWGPITGIVHGAGVLADKRLAEKSGDDFRHVFGTKIGGLRSLLAATANDPLAVICLFSSVAARTGNAGQADYAMANEVLNRVAHELARQRSGCVVKSIGWGPWAGGMVTPLLKAKFDELGVPLIPLASGARAFRRRTAAGRTGRSRGRHRRDAAAGAAAQSTASAAGAAGNLRRGRQRQPPIPICSATRSTAWSSCRW